MFAPKPADAWAGLEVIVEECGNQPAATSPSITLANLTEDSDVAQRRQLTLDLFSSQTPEEESQFHKARSQRLGHIARELRAKDGGVPVQSRLRGLRQYDACFIGAEAVNWLLNHRYARTRVEAVMVGNDLMDAGHFHHVADKTDYVERRYKYAFKDSSEDYYRFYVHEVEEPNQLKKRMEKREKLRQKHRRTKSEVPQTRDSEPLSSPRSHAQPGSAIHDSEPLSSPRSHDRRAPLGSTLTIRSGSHAVTRGNRTMSSSDPAMSAGASSSDNLPSVDSPRDGDSIRGDARRDDLRSSGEGDSQDSSPSSSSLPARVKSRVRQVVGEKLRPAWVETTYAASEGLTPEEVESIVWGYQRVEDTSPEEMEALSNVNTLHKGSPERATGTIYMIGMDGTEASKRAFQMLVSHILKPSDYVYLVANVA